MVSSIDNPGDQSPWSLENWGKGTVMLLPIAFAMPTFKLVILVKIGDPGDRFQISRFWGCGAYLGCVTFGIFCLATAVSCGGHND